MIYIDISKLEIPKGWEEKARQALDAASKAAPDKRSAIINKKKHAEVWKLLKSPLKQLSNDKCWYCESKQERSDNAVDHFRPKNRIEECKEHPGYWWLAFDCTNYRFSCTFCNSRRIDQEGGTDGGKHDHFPLIDPEMRAFCDTDDYEDEQPCLLDPTKATDPGLLWFDQNGQPVPKYDEVVNPIFYQRAKESIHLYHLDHQALVSNRMVLFNYLQRKVKDGNRYLNKCVKGDTTAKHALDATIHDLIKAASRESEYSLAARAYLSGLRSNDNDWLDAVLLAF